MTGPQRAIASQQRGPRLRGTPGGEPVRVWLLGGFRVTVGPRSIGEEEWRLKKAASLLKLLALAPGHRLHREQAMELLWPDLDPEAALNNLHYALHVARRTLEPSAPASNAASRYLHLRDERLTLYPEGPLWVDVEAFEEAAATARHALLEPAAYRAAMDVYGGELLPEDRYELWVEERGEELRGAYLSLLMELAGLYEKRREFGEAIEALQWVVAEGPSQEEAHTGLMRLYALSGRRREALRQYERLREAHFREFGTEPEAPATRLQEEIWAGTFPPADSPPARFAPEEPPFTAGAGKHNLPLRRTSFVGRERETLEVKRLLAMTRLLTLTGAGGSGKTRLALEVAWVVPSLSVPDPRQEAPTAEELEGYESVRLFVERARYRNPSFVLTPRNVQAVAEVCRRLDGIPLAIELAAARMGVLCAGQIAKRLDDSLGLLTAGGRMTDPRHGTLRGTLDWSFELLSEPEREL